VCYKQRDEEDHTKVDDQGRRHAHDQDDLMHDLVALRSKEHQDSEQKADERPRSGELQEYLIILALADQPPEHEAGGDRSSQRDTQKHPDGFGDSLVGHLRIGAANNAEE